MSIKKLYCHLFVIALAVSVHGCATQAYAKSDTSKIWKNELAINIAGYRTKFIEGNNFVRNEYERLSFDYKTNLDIGLRYTQHLKGGFYSAWTLRVNPFWTCFYSYGNLVDSLAAGNDVKEVRSINLSYMLRYKAEHLDYGIGLNTGYFFGGRTHLRMPDKTLGFVDDQGNLIWTKHTIFGPCFEVGYTLDEIRISLYHQRSVIYPLTLGGEFKITPGNETGIQVSYRIKGW